VSDQIDFHPTDVLEDADGSLLIVDTGGWYKLCCPTSQLAKPDVMGAIYRVRRKGAPRPVDPRGQKIDWAKSNSAQVAKLLDDERPYVRHRAMETLAARGEKAVPSIEAVRRKSDSVVARRNAVWTLAQVKGQQAREVVNGALNDGNRTVRAAAAQVAGLWRDAGATANLVSALKGSGPDVKRPAAQALGRIGAKSAVPELLSIAGSQSDAILEHSLIYALIEIGDRTSTERGLQFPNPKVRRTALVALDQMEGGGVTADQVTQLLASSDSALKQTAAWIIGRHPEWGGSLAVYFREGLANPKLTSPERDDLRRQLAQFARNGAVQELLVATLRDASSVRESRITVLEAMARAGLKETPAGWFPELIRAMDSENPVLSRQAVLTARSLAIPKGGQSELTAALNTV